MPARKKPIPAIEQVHYSADQVRQILGVSLARAYAIIHECIPYGPVLKSGGTLRVSESAFKTWYELHNISSCEPEGRRCQ